MTKHLFTDACLQPYHVHENWHDFDCYSRNEDTRAIFTLDTSTGEWGDPIYIADEGSEELDPQDVPEDFKDKVRQFRAACMARYKP
jgi:hypothetical protein